jgi:hypothetical protein
MPDRYPGYDVLSKRDTPSWNEQTRRAIDERLAVREDEALFFDAHEFATVQAIAACLVPQPQHQPRIPVAALVDRKLHQDQGDGYRHAGMPRLREAWRQSLRALDEEARAAHGAAFKDLRVTEQESLLQRMQDGGLHGEAWGSMKPEICFSQRIAKDIVYAYYSHPSAWNEIGWGGPASPRGYVRTGYDERDPWEAAEVKNGDVEAARRKNRHVG